MFKKIWICCCIIIMVLLFAQGTKRICSAYDGYVQHMTLGKKQVMILLRSEMVEIRKHIIR